MNSRLQLQMNKHWRRIILFTIGTMIFANIQRVTTLSNCCDVDLTAKSLSLILLANMKNERPRQLFQKENVLRSTIMAIGSHGDIDDVGIPPNSQNYWTTTLPKLLPCWCFALRRNMTTASVSLAALKPVSTIVDTIIDAMHIFIVFVLLYARWKFCGNKSVETGM